MHSIYAYYMQKEKQQYDVKQRIVTDLIIKMIIKFICAVKILKVEMNQ